MRARIVGVEDGIAIDVVRVRHGAAHVAHVYVLAIRQMVCRVIPVVAIAARARRRHAAWTARIHGNARALEPNVLARTIGNGHRELGNIERMHGCIRFELLPLVVIAHAECTNRLARGRGSVETNLAAIRERANLRGRETRKNEFAHARRTAGRAAGAARRHDAAIRTVDFTFAGFAVAGLNDAIAAIRILAVVVAGIRRYAIAVVALFTEFHHAIAARCRRIRQHVAIAHAATAACAAAAAGAAAARATITLAVRTVRPARLHTHGAAGTRTSLGIINHAATRCGAAAAAIGLAAAGLQRECRKHQGETRNEQFLDQATHCQTPGGDALRRYDRMRPFS